MEFEFLTNQLLEEKKEPLVSIAKNNVLVFNRAAIKQYGIVCGQLVLLGYDKKTNAIGIKFLQEPHDGAKKILVCQDKRSAQVGATRFLRFYKITQRGRFSLNYDKAQKILYFTLKFEGKID